MKSAIAVILIGLSSMVWAVQDQTIIIFDPVEGTLKPIIVIGDD